MTSYQPLFNVDIEHGFFPGRGCRGLELEPTAASRGLLQRMGCVTKFAGGGLQAWSDIPSGGSSDVWRDESGGPAHLSFLAFARDPLFASYTRHLPPPDGTVLVFDSTKVRPADSDGRTRLHDAEYVSQADVQPFAAPAVSEVLSMRTRLLPPAFVLRIASSALQGHGPLGCRYYVRFAASATLWKYYLPSAWASDAIQIVDVNRETDFNPAVAEELPDGRAVLTIRSRTEIELQERSSRRFQLRHRDGRAHQIIIKRLPVAGAAEQYEETIDSAQRRVSHIHVGF